MNLRVPLSRKKDGLETPIRRAWVPTTTPESASHLLCEDPEGTEKTVTRGSRGDRGDRRHPKETLRTPLLTLVATPGSLRVRHRRLYPLRPHRDRTAPTTPTGTPTPGRGEKTTLEGGEESVGDNLCMRGTASRSTTQVPRLQGAWVG